MQLSCSRDELSRSLQTVLRSVGARAGIPALSGVLIELDEHQLDLTTTDLELTTKVTVPVSGQAGQVVVPARLLAEVVRNLSGEHVELVQDDGTLRVSGGQARFSLRCLAAEDFPRLEMTGERKELDLDGDKLRSALAQVVVAASRDETRPVLTGVLLEGEADELRLVATDSYRLALGRLQVSGAQDVKLLIPARAVQEAGRLGGDSIRVAVSGSQVSFEAGNTVVRSRLIEGEFPAYGQLLPGSLPNHLEADRATFLQSLRRVAVVAQDAVPVFLELDESEVRFTCHSQGLGEATETVDAQYKGEPMRVAFNAGYLQAGLDVVADERMRIELSDPQRPAVVRGVDSDDYTYLLMPVRVA